MKSPGIHMDKNHEIAFHELYDYFLDRTDDDTMRRVEFHLASCVECRELLRVMALLSGASEDEVSPRDSGHPLLEELVSYYKDPSLLSTAVITQLETHLAKCAECRSEIKFLQELEDDMSRALPSGNDAKK